MDEGSFRVTVVGAAGVGKSALIVSFIAGRFLHNYDPTLEDEYSATMTIQGCCYNLTLKDTAGQVSKVEFNSPNILAWYNKAS